MTPDQPTVFQAVGETVARASELVQLEIRLAKAELADKLVHVKAGLISIVVGAIVLTAALFLLVQALVIMLVQFGMNPLGATLIVTAALVVAGLACVFAGGKQLESDSLVPRRTLADLERDRALVKEKLS